jgi:hypothetical protein
MSLPGFPSLASIIASHKDKSTFIFKRFESLAARNLLYLQSEVAAFQAELDQRDEFGRSASLEVKNTARNWEHFVAHAETSDPKPMKLLLDIRAKMKEYSENIYYL